MKKVLLLLLFFVSLNVSAQFEMTNGEIHYRNNEETMLLTFKDKSLNELINKSIVFLEENYDCNVLKFNNRLEFKIENTDVYISKKQLIIKYKMILNFKDDGVYVFSPQIDNIGFVKNRSRVYLDRGSNNANSVYIYKKNGELKRVQMTSEGIW